MPLRITTWNVNGIRNPFGYQPWRDTRTFDGMFNILEADIVIMQELKIQRKDLRDDMVLVPGWDCYFSLPVRKKGYSGVGIYTRQSTCAPIRAEEGLLGVLSPPGSSTAYRDLSEDKHIGGYLTPLQITECGVDPVFLDSEGRCMVLEFPAFVLFGIYSPANSSGTRDDFRKGFITALDMRIRNLIKQGKRVVVCGDLNVSREEIDTANADEMIRKDEDLTHEKYVSAPNRRIFNQLLEGGLVYGERDEDRETPVMWDTTREFHPDRKGMYTHWEQKINARPGNFGSRIDFVLVSLAMKDWVCEANIQEGLHGSDHCPVYALLKDEVNIDGDLVHLSDIMNPAGYFQHGKRVKEYSVKDIPAVSGKLLPEFDKRRSIRDMFTKTPALKQTTSALDKEAEEAGETASNGTPAEPVTCLPSSMQRRRSDGSIVTSNAGESPERKRPALESTARPSKKIRSNGAMAASANVPSKGQASLKGFFKPKAVPSQASASAAAASQPSTLSADLETPASSLSSITSPQRKQTTPVAQSPTLQHKPANESPSPSQVHDPIASKESWTNMFNKRRGPLCECHQEPCMLMKTKKPGVNFGREFYMCTRPLGPTGDKERNTQWRCPTFIWASDWKL